MSGPASSIVGWAVEALIASALLMALVLLVRGPVRRMFGPQVAYALWALPLLRLVLPPLPWAWRDATATPISRAGETVIVVLSPMTADAAVTATASPAPFATLVTGVIVAWGVGAIGFMGYHLIRHASFCRRIVAECDGIEKQGGIRIVTSAAAPGPLAFGVLRRYVAFPIDFADRYDADERALALAHEIGHHQRGDLIANWIALAVLALHWFNPLAWRAFSAFRADQELANDARVLSGRSAVERHIYACAIVKAAHGGAVAAACHLHTITDLKGRLKMLSLSPASRRRLASGGCAVAALAVAGLGLTASGSSAAAISAGVKEAVQQAVPSMPPVAAVPGTTATTSSDAKSATTTLANGHKVKKVIVTNDGNTTVYENADVDALLAQHQRVEIAPLEQGSSRMIVKMDGDPDTRVEVQIIPAVSSANCGIGKGKPMSMVIDGGKGEKRKIVICTDRIRQVTADAMVTVGNTRDVERNAYVSALDGLTTARTRIAANTDMSEADRARALTAIDQSIIEMKSQLARFN